MWSLGMENDIVRIMWGLNCPKNFPFTRASGTLFSLVLSELGFASFAVVPIFVASVAMVFYYQLISFAFAIAIFSFIIGGQDLLSDMGIFSDSILFHRNPKSSSPKGQTSSIQLLPSLPLPVGSPSMHDTALIASSDGTIHLVEIYSSKVRWSFSSGLALCSSHQAVEWGKDDKESLMNGDYSIECGDDWNLYVRKRTLDKVEPTGTMGKYVNSGPHYLKGIFVLGHKEVIIFSVDARTGRVNSAVSNVNGQILFQKNMGESTNTPANELLITRTNYKLHAYFLGTTKLVWDLTVGYIKFTCHCSNFGRTYNGDDMPFPCGAKGVVYRTREHNPLQFELKSLDSRDEDEVDFLTVPQPSNSTMLNMSPYQLGKGANDGIIRFHFISPFSSSFMIIVLVILIILVVTFRRNERDATIQKKKKKKGKRNERDAKKKDYVGTSQGKNKNNVSTSQGKNENNGSTSQACIQLEDMEIPPSRKRNGVPFILIKELEQAKMMFEKYYSIMGLVPNENEEHMEELALKEFVPSPPPYLVQDYEKRSGRILGKLFVSERVIAEEGNGTVIFEGMYNRKVHVDIKRVVARFDTMDLGMLDTLLILQQHGNIVNVIDFEWDDTYFYFALEPCAYNLYELMQLCSNKMNQDEFAMQIVQKLYLRDGCPSPVLVNLIRDMVCGLDHLHFARLTNRDLKPQRVLINFGEPPSAKICDQGIIDNLRESAHLKSPGWHSPDLFLSVFECPEWEAREQGAAVDLFNLGCLIFYFITKGGHPFGPDEWRDANIKNNCHDLSLLEEHNYEAADLIYQLLQPQPEMRPRAVFLLHHPFFWDSEKRGLFLQDVSGWLEHFHYRKSVFNAMMNAQRVIVGNWDVKMEASVLAFAASEKCYNYDSLLDLLLLIGNIISRHKLLSKDLKVIIGSTHGEIYDYFGTRFPNLLFEVYRVISKCRAERLLGILDDIPENEALFKYA